MTGRPSSEIHADAAAPRERSQTVGRTRCPYVGSRESAACYVGLEPGGEIRSRAVSFSRLWLKVGDERCPRIPAQTDRERRLDMFALAHELHAGAHEGMKPGVFEELANHARRCRRDSEVVITLKWQYRRATRQRDRLEGVRVLFGCD